MQRPPFAQEMGKDDKDEHTSEAKALAAALSPATWPVVLLQLLDLTTELAGNGILQAAAGTVVRLRGTSISSCPLGLPLRNQTMFHFLGNAAAGPQG